MRTTKRNPSAARGKAQVEMVKKVGGAVKTGAKKVLGGYLKATDKIASKLPKGPTARPTAKRRRSLMK